ncbi:MAG: hypothetical protein ACYDC2_09895 [Solirubrobacteraceae bacterium]
MLGVLLLTAPQRLLRCLPRERADTFARGFARLLGARHLVQAAIIARRHTRNWVLAGAAVDAVHAASMVCLARLMPARRELALTSAAVASVLAGAGAREAGRRRSPAG